MLQTSCEEHKTRTHSGFSNFFHQTLWKVSGSRNLTFCVFLDKDGLLLSSFLFFFFFSFFFCSLLPRSSFFLFGVSSSLSSVSLARASSALSLSQNSRLFVWYWYVGLCGLCAAGVCVWLVLLSSELALGPLRDGWVGGVVGGALVGGVSCRVGPRLRVYVPNAPVLAFRDLRVFQTFRRFERTHGDVLTPHTPHSTHKTTHYTDPRQHTQTPSTHTDPVITHITITRSGNGPSTRVPWVMQITLYGSHVSRVCASLLLIWGLCYTLFSPRFCSWMYETTILSSWRFVCVSRIGRRRVKWPRRRPRLRRVRVRSC